MFENYKRNIRAAPKVVAMSTHIAEDPVLLFSLRMLSIAAKVASIGSHPAQISTERTSSKARFIRIFRAVFRVLVELFVVVVSELDCSKVRNF
jgi:hypothetical protein